MLIQQLEEAENGGVKNGKYEIPIETDLKDYYIIQEEYNNHFGTKKVISPMKGTSGKDRFYVMALEDINYETYYCWYRAASGNLDNTVSPNFNDFGFGREFTEYVMAKWNDSSLPWGEHNSGDYLDLWGIIENEINKGWFVPSKAEWAAFGSALGINFNYADYGLNFQYWTSSQCNSRNVYLVLYVTGEGIGGIAYNTNLRDYAAVRLSITV